MFNLYYTCICWVRSPCNKKYREICLHFRNLNIYKFLLQHFIWPANFGSIWLSNRIKFHLFKAKITTYHLSFWRGFTGAFRSQMFLTSMMTNRELGSNNNNNVCNYEKQYLQHRWISSILEKLWSSYARRLRSRILNSAAAATGEEEVGATKPTCISLTGLIESLRFLQVRNDRN